MMLESTSPEEPTSGGAVTARRAGLGRTVRSSIVRNMMVRCAMLEVNATSTPGDAHANTHTTAPTQEVLVNLSSAQELSHRCWVATLAPEQFTPLIT